MPITVEHAIKVQEQLAGAVRMEPLPAEFHWLGAGWVHFRSPEPATEATAAAVLLEWPSLRIERSACVTMAVNFPYIPGLFAFRAMTPLWRAFEELHRRPDVLIVNGQGIDHIRRFGMASYLGVMLNIPTVGCTRGTPPFPVPEVAMERGATALIRDGEEAVGAAVRTCDGVSPVYVSPGHWADLASSIDLTLQCGRGRRLPEPLRIARGLARQG